MQKQSLELLEQVQEKEKVEKVSLNKFIERGF